MGDETGFCCILCLAGCLFAKQAANLTIFHAPCCNQKQIPLILKLLEFRTEGIYCPPGRFFIDPWKSVDKAIITHAHADHARWGMKYYLCHDLSRPILQSRLAENIVVESLPYGKVISINGVKVSLHPAGHIIGSSQVRLEYKGYVSVVSGDYKLEDDGISTPFASVRCHEFVTESTFGLPIYRWRPQQEIIAEIRNWIKRNQKQEKTSVFTAYSLGKAQRLMVALDGVAEMYVHTAIDRIHKVLATVGVALPVAKVLQEEKDKKALQGKVIIIPPAGMGPELIKKIPRVAVAICSGWTQIRGRRRWESADAGFTISDHADWDGLLSAVKSCGAEKVWVTHGASESFARYLNETGFNAAVVSTMFGEDEET